MKQFLPVLLIFCFFQGASQGYLQHFNHISNQNGLANNIVTDIVQDREGYIWIGTLAGLQRYDGKSFVTFKNNPSVTTSIPSNTVVRLLIDQEGKIWVITSKGVCIYDKNTNVFNPVKGDFGFVGLNTITNFFQDVQGTVWLGVKGVSTYFLDETTATFTPYSKPWPAYSIDPTFIQQNRKNGEYWLAANEIVLHFDPKTSLYKPFNLNKILSELTGERQRVSQVQSFVLDKNNLLWITLIANGDKPFSISCDLNSDRWQIIYNNEFHVLNSILTTYSGVTWAAADSLLRYNGNDRWIAVDSRGEASHSISSKAEFIYIIFEDRDGSIWLGTDNGIFVFTPNEQKFSYTADIFETHQLDVQRDSLQARNFQIAETSNSYIVIGSEIGDGSVDVFLSDFKRAGKFSDFIRDPDKDYQSVSSLLTVQNDIVWLGAKNGKIARLNFTTSERRNFRSATLRSSKITALSEQSPDELWIGSSSGVLVLWSVAEAREKIIFDLRKYKAFKPDRITSILKDEEANCLWVATSQQLLRVDLGEPFTVDVIAIDQGLIITQLRDWKFESVLVGTSQGLYLLDKKTKKCNLIVTETGVFSYFIAGLVIDQFQNIWASTKGNGLFRISYSLKEVRRYGANEGILYSNFLTGCNLRTHDNRIIFGTTQGILSFDPDLAPTPLFNPRVKITSFRVNDVEYLQNEKQRVTKEPIQLDWQQNTISVEFSAMSYAYKDQVSFSYILEGQDRQWINTNNPELIKYSSLTPGSYTFRVRCKPATGEVISDEVIQSFVIVPPFWATWWFKMLIVLFLTALVIAIYQIRIQRILLVQGIKNKISQDLHDHIGSSLSSMSIMLKVAENSVSKNAQQAATLLHKVSETAQLTQENLHDIVWSIDAGKNSMHHIIDRMREFMESVFDGRQINTHLLIPHDLEKAKLRLDKRYNLYLIFKEIVNNGAKYAQAENVRVEIIQRKNIIELSYSDDGIGFDLNTQTLGNGVENMQNRAKAMDGLITIDTAPGKGTKINLRFPI